MPVPFRNRYHSAFFSPLVLGIAALCAQTASGVPQSPNLPRLAPRPGYITGRAVFEDGRPIPNFNVSAESGFGGAGKVQATAGTYALQVTNPSIYVVQNILAKAVIDYHGQTYVLPLHPIDGLPDGAAANNFRGDVTKGVVRDFVFRLAGLAPGGQIDPPAPNVTDTDSFSVRTSFEGCPIQIELARESSALANATLQITLTPNGPLIDGSAGRVIQRSVRNLNPNFFYYLYDIPLGVYTASASTIGSTGTAQPVHLRLSIPTTPVTSGPTPQTTVSVTWPFDAKSQLLARPVLTILP
jgi:hypothetical protein